MTHEKESGLRHRFGGAAGCRLDAVARSLAKSFDVEQQFAATVVKTGVKDEESWSDSSGQYDPEGAVLRSQ